MSDKKKLTTNVGCSVAHNQNVMTAGPRGPQLLQDVWFLEKLAHFDLEVIPERLVCDGAAKRMKQLHFPSCHRSLTEQADYSNPKNQYFHHK